MQETRLEAAVDPVAPRLRRLRRRLVFAIGFLAGASGVAALVVAIMQTPAREAPIGPAPPPVAMPVVVPTVVTVEPAPAPAPAPAWVDPLGCPVDFTDNEPKVGRAVRADDLPRSEDVEDAAPRLRVLAAAHADVIAVWRDDQTAWVSDDDGAHFKRVFGDRSVAGVAVGPSGTLYGMVEGDLGVREPDGKTRIRKMSGTGCDNEFCNDQLAAVGDRVVWFHDQVVMVGTENGRSWETVERDSTWQEYGHDADVFTWQGAIYAVDHYTDMCGVDDTPVNRFDGKHTAYEIFHHYYMPGEPVLEASSEVGASWTWRTRCWPAVGDDDEPYPESARARCHGVPAARVAMLTAATLRPHEGGGRALATFDGSLVELCPGGARQVYRRFPYARISAVDSQGRPLVVDGDAVLRWSWVHGWRQIYAYPSPETAGGE